MNISNVQSNLLWQFKKCVIYRRIAENMLVFLLQYSGLMLSTLVSTPKVVWLASGTACAFIFLRGVTVLPGICLGSFVAYYSAHSGMLLAVECSVLFTLQVYLILWFSYRFIVPSLLFYRIKHFIKFILFSSAITAVVSILLMLCCYSTFIAPVWITNWLANLNGILIVSIGLITWDAYFPEIHLLKQKNNYLYLLYGILFISIVSFILSANILFALLTLPIVLIAALYYKWCGVMAAVFLIGLTLTLAANFSLAMTIFLQILLIIETITALTISIVRH
jgi:integral membrane sensor domain MASE1